MCRLKFDLWGKCDDDIETKENSTDHFVKDEGGLIEPDHESDKSVERVSLSVDKLSNKSVDETPAVVPCFDIFIRYLFKSSSDFSINETVLSNVRHLFVDLKKRRKRPKKFSDSASNVESDQEVGDIGSDVETIESVGNVRQISDPPNHFENLILPRTIGCSVSSLREIKTDLNSRSFNSDDKIPVSSRLSTHISFQSKSMQFLTGIFPLPFYSKLPMSLCVIVRIISHSIVMKPFFIRLPYVMNCMNRFTKFRLYRVRTDFLLGAVKQK